MPYCKEHRNIEARERPVKPEAKERKLLAQRERRQRTREEQLEAMAPQERFPPKTSKLALLVYAEVFKALTSYNIKYLPEFNYLTHRLYQKATYSKERGLRADLLVEIELGNQEPMILVIEAQGKEQKTIQCISVY
jgi:uncharacterized Rmd1/YagE family protein